MHKPYRRPTVAVIGAGPAGCAAAADCAFSGFDVTLVEATDEIGGTAARPGGPAPSKRLRFRTPYLDRKAVDGTAAGFRAHLREALDAAGADVRLRTEARAAAFDHDTGQWRVAVTTPDGDDVVCADVLIRATGGDTVLDINPGSGRILDAEPRLHRAIEVVGAPNLLFVDAPVTGLSARRPLDVAEARADHARRYIRTLEIRGPGAFTVRASNWHASPPDRRHQIRDLGTIDAASHSFTPAASPIPEARLENR
ncbi:FAD-dependent oxidoreductase [Corynebacterium amycolatum]|uniref:FAD-dependent oxidoreductase n=1 Tax=Corynebacterium amycolatum TaxID=43765 RepID=UPI000E206234|nr:FAD-dependent oxidoreductase [Corynebacterium amycolatum]